MTQVLGKELKEGINLPLDTEVVFDVDGKTYLKVPLDCLIKKDNVTDETNKFNHKHLKGYIFDSLVYRYKNAREKLAIYENNYDKQDNKPDYFWEANRDLTKFIKILNEAIGEHD